MYYNLHSTALENNLSRSRVVCLHINAGSYHQIQEEVIAAAREKRSSSICFANVHMVVEATQNKYLADCVNNATWVVADGVPLVWAIRAIYQRKQERVTGLDFLPDLLDRACEEDLSVYFYGSTTDVLQATLHTCQQKFPSLKIAGTYSPPFRALTSEEEDLDVKRIVDSGAQLVFVALGCPRQEVWISRMRHRIPAVLLGIGGALPVLAGKFSRAPNWMQRFGLEWLFRLSQEPTRLFRRYFTTNTLFVFYFLRGHLMNK
ncbi:WecB/TagA/CpsF family glycosyltransferase [Salmonirosea aquatica]|uniref:WecB/TagA/CpsF family glycosyltransferase n=1 Tax=Salmonirosea aquatica TaxID=2654236 RepID=A0A7C9BK40_9BACT|nr:WecB/TagA/CpsF family glycosyltransferase [Cytophagaceae bacterium SJW1-29]